MRADLQVAQVHLHPFAGFPALQPQPHLAHIFTSLSIVLLPRCYLRRLDMDDPPFQHEPLPLTSVQKIGALIFSLGSSFPKSVYLPLLFLFEIAAAFFLASAFEDAPHA